MSSALHVLFRGEEESWNAFSRRIRETEGEVIVVLSTADNNFLLQDDERKLFVGEIAKIRYRVQLATKEPAVIRSARREGIRVYAKTRALRRVLKGHPKATEALRFFSPSLWRQHWRSKLQSIGILSLPRLRIWTLIGLSALLFLFVLFRLLPSAEVRVWPRKDLVTHTMNIVLVVSGSTVELPEHVRTMPLVPVSVRTHRALTFTDISPEFIGSDAEVPMTVYNDKPQQITLREGTRLLNQAGMVFKIQQGITIPAKSKTSVRAVAEHLDIYDKVIGDRGNVPAGVQWQLPGLPEEDKKLVYARNLVAARGGRTAYRTVLQQKDLELARKRLEQELRSSAAQLIEEERQMLNDRGGAYSFLNKTDLIKTVFSGFVLPMSFIGQAVTSVPVEGSIIYTVPAYDGAAILSRYRSELHEHVGDGKRLLEDTVNFDPEAAVVIEYADNLSWIKMTVDVVGTEEFVLDPLTVTGVRFGKRVRDAVAGLPAQDAVRILKNFPEVDRVDIRLWPPWSVSLPSIPSNIAIDPQ